MDVEVHNDEDEIIFACYIFLFITEVKICHLSLFTTFT